MGASSSKKTGCLANISFVFCVNTRISDSVKLLTCVPGFLLLFKKNHYDLTDSNFSNTLSTKVLSSFIIFIKKQIL